MTDTPPAVEEEAPLELPKRDPGEFTEGAFAPATEALSLKDRLRTQELQGTKRPPGRPKGSRNRGKPETDLEDKTAAERLKDLQKDRSAKKQRSDEIAGAITGELNDAILRLIIAQGAPPALLYNAGHAPVSVSKANEKYTPIGRKIAVDDFTAGMVGSFVAEFEGSDLGMQLVGKATGGPVGLVVKGLVAGACVIGYLNGVRQVIAEIQPMVAAYQEYQKNQQQNNRQGVNNSGLN